MQDDCIDDYHDQYRAEDDTPAHDEVQTRVQHQRLPCDHGAPAEDDQGCVEGGDIVCDVEVFQDEADCVDGDAPGGYEEAPEIESRAALEGEE